MRQWVGGFDLAFEDVMSVDVTQTPRGLWQVIVEGRDISKRLPLNDAMIGKKRVGVRTTNDAQAHPVVDALQNALGDKVTVRERAAI